MAQVLADRGYVKDADNISLSELECITELDVSNANLKSLDKIEAFKSLTKLNCSKNNIVELILNNNGSLEYLDCSENNLYYLDAVIGPTLKYLDCSKNHISYLYINADENLEYLDCSDNDLSDLHYPNISKLKYLDCSRNGTTINPFTGGLGIIEHNPNLEHLKCSYNHIEWIYLENNPKLIELECKSNKLKSLNISGIKNLKTISCDENPGDGSTFRIHSWFDNSSIPSTLEIGAKSWEYEGNTITIDFYN